jgi:hypothetical protein
MTLEILKEIAKKETEDFQWKSKKGKQVLEDQTDTTKGGYDNDDDDYDNMVSFIGIFFKSFSQTNSFNAQTNSFKDYNFRWNLPDP